MTSRATSTSRPRRLTPQKEQEHVSRGQLVEALKGWVCNSLSEDFGEDFFVSIYDDGRSTGLTFQLQLKSTADAASLVPKRNADEIRYGLEVADLEHWEDASPPVVVVIWDVVKRVGYWQDVPAIIKALSKKNKKWRTKETVTVSVPVRQQLDEAGRKALRHRVGTLVLPALSTGKTLEITPRFQFPNTSAGRASLEALKSAIEEGGTVTITKDNIEQFKMSPWWEKIFGPTVPDSVTLSPSSPEINLPLLLEAVGEAGTERIHLNLKRTTAGTKRSTFVNEGPNDPVKLTLKMDTDQANAHLHMGFAHPHPNVQSCLLLTKLLLVVRRGGSLRVLLPNGKALGALHLDPKRLPATKDLMAWERLLTMLAFVQSRTSRYGEFSVRPQVTPEDLEKANRLRVMCSTAEEETRMTFSIDLKSPPKLPPRSAEKPGPPEFAIEIDPFGDIELLGVTVPKGRVRVTFLEGDDVLKEFQAAQRDGRASLKFEDTLVRLQYVEWAHPNTGPAHTAASRVIGEAPTPRSRPVKRLRDKQGR